MAPPERRDHMRRLRLSISRNDIFRWVDDYLDAAVSKQLSDFPYLEDYIPPLEGHET
jgi:trehalose 6-phosphate synthase